MTDAELDERLPHQLLAAASPLPGPLRRVCSPRAGGLRAACLGDFPLLTELAPAFMERVTIWLAFGDDPEFRAHLLAAQPPIPATEQAAAAFVFSAPFTAVWKSVRAGGADVAQGQIQWQRLPADTREKLPDTLLAHLLEGFDASVLYQPVQSSGEGEIIFDAELPDADGLGWWLRLAARLTTEYTHDWDRTMALPIGLAFALRAASDERAGHRQTGRGYIARELAARTAIATPPTPA